MMCLQNFLPGKPRGSMNAMFDIENKADPSLAWAEVKKHISIAAFTIQAAAGTLTNVLQKGFCRVASSMEKYCVVSERETDGEWVLTKWIPC